ncbi:hypothetical protein [Paenibacillus solani]|uniref:hypothetical protein n=1 Tax=Paenibacillus solani TaxID=1705565 RepID=UPI003D281C3E
MKKATVFALSTCLFFAASAMTASAAPVEKHEHQMHVKEHQAKEHKLHAKEHKHKAKEHKMRTKSKGNKIHTKSITPKALPKTGYGGVSE